MLADGTGSKQLGNYTAGAELHGLQPCPRILLLKSVTLLHSQESTLNSGAALMSSTVIHPPWSIQVEQSQEEKVTSVFIS